MSTSRYAYPKHCHNLSFQEAEARPSSDNLNYVATKPATKKGE